MKVSGHPFLIAITLACFGLGACGKAKSDKSTHSLTQGTIVSGAGLTVSGSCQVMSQSGSNTTDLLNLVGFKVCPTNDASTVAISYNVYNPGMDYCVFPAQGSNVPSDYQCFTTSATSNVGQLFVKFSKSYDTLYLILDKDYDAFVSAAFGDGGSYPTYDAIKFR